MSAARILPWPSILDAELPDVEPVAEEVTTLAEAQRVKEAPLCDCQCHRACDGRPGCRYDCAIEGAWGDD